MSKKKFNTGLDSILGEAPKPKSGIIKETEIRATFILDKELLEKIKSIAYWDRILIKDVVSCALAEAISKYENNHGEIKPMPKK